MSTNKEAEGLGRFFSLDITRGQKVYSKLGKTARLWHEILARMNKYRRRGIEPVYT
jgi:hypothetical protein